MFQISIIPIKIPLTIKNQGEYPLPEKGEVYCLVQVIFKDHALVFNNI